jgi:hypothetical protein
MRHTYILIANISGKRTIKLLHLFILLFFTIACSDFVAVDIPKQQLSTAAVFNNSGNVEAALRGVYIKMRDQGLLTASGLNSNMGFYTDALDNYAFGASESNSFQNHTLLSNNSIIEFWWGSAYAQIYAANAIIEGLEHSEALTLEEIDHYKGEALFIRGYLHFLLMALFGDIPYITTTDYTENTTVSRAPQAAVYSQILIDLNLAAALLPDEDMSGERVRPYQAVAEAVLARVYLYNEQWDMAEVASDKVITQFGALEPDLNKVFLKDAPGTIWQFKSEGDGRNTIDGALAIFITGPPTNWALTDDLFFAFEPPTVYQRDHRQSEWISTVSDGTTTWRHAFKYKERDNTDTSREYQIQLRLAEQYLIRAEARAHLGDISGAQADINAIRNRAGLGDTSAATLKALLDAILQERRVELFTEGGHRWFDLKRMGKAAEVLAPIKPGWRDTDVLLPIPEAELLSNPNLLPQNDGYD